MLALRYNSARRLHGRLRKAYGPSFRFRRASRRGARARRHADRRWTGGLQGTGDRGPRRDRHHPDAAIRADGSHSRRRCRAHQLRARTRRHVDAQTRSATVSGIDSRHHAAVRWTRPRGLYAHRRSNGHRRERAPRRASARRAYGAQGSTRGRLRKGAGGGKGSRASGGAGVRSTTGGQGRDAGTDRPAGVRGHRLSVDRGSWAFWPSWDRSRWCSSWCSSSS